jgi:uncharacterized protein (TIGR00369 family)
MRARDVLLAAGVSLRNQPHRSKTDPGDAPRRPAPLSVATALGELEVRTTVAITHGGYASVLLDTCMGGAIHTELKPGQSVATLECKMNFMRPMSPKTGLVRGQGRVIHVGRQAGWLKDVCSTRPASCWPTAQQLATS